MDRIKKQSEFSRVKYNDAKMGAYYTDVGHCVSIGMRKSAVLNHLLGMERQFLP